MSINDNLNNKKNIQEQIEERVKYFIKSQPQKNNKQKKIKLSPYMDSLQTLKDPLNIQDDYFIENCNNIFKKTQINNNDKKNNNILNDIIINTPKTNKQKINSNDSTLSTQTLNILDIPLKKATSIHVSKELSKCTEPRYKKKEFLKLSPKFSSININNDSFFTNDDDMKSSKHKYTNSELELLETDEKIPQHKIKEITSNALNNSTEDIFGNKILTIFHYLANVEKFYQELSKDLKGNGIKNMGYKLKIACNYINEISEENSIINDIISDSEKEFNIFLIRELCYYLIILFLDNFEDKLNDNNIRELLTCHNYCHTNLLYITMICIQIIEQHLSENKIKIEENSIEYYNYQKCKVLIRLNSDKINANKYKENFHTNNKIIKNIFLNIINNLDDKDNPIIKTIREIFNLSKKSNFKTIINDFIKNNSVIKEKMNDIIMKYHSPENNNENIDKQLNGGANGLQKIEPPYLPPKRQDDERDYCLVLDLDETLVHFFEDNNEAYVKVRMGAENLITVLSQYCEIIIFTASTRNYADIVIDGLDCKNLIDYKLYREHTDDYNGINVKDLSKLGRDLNKIIIIDNIEENYILQPKNGLNIIDFEGDENDNELQYILEDLLKIVKVPGKNITEELSQIRENMQKRYCNI
jgi:hypothetical protein